VVSVETTPGMRGKEDDGEVNSSSIYLMYCKNFCKYHNVPRPSTTIKKSKLLTNLKKEKQIL
jgi:hypothetical protein